MNDLYLPNIGSWLYIREEITPANIQYQRVHHLINVLTPEGLCLSTENRHSTYVLRPGEWYVINNVVYPPRTPGFGQDSPCVSLSLLRSRASREWVRDRLKEISKEITDQVQLNININSDEQIVVRTKCNTRSIMAMGSDLNGRTWVLPNEAQAIAARIRYLTDPPRNLDMVRFESLLLD